MKRKLFVDYPVARTYEEALYHLQEGGELWQEIESEYPECGGIEDIDTLKECTAYEDDSNDKKDIRDYYIHLVPPINTTKWIPYESHGNYFRLFNGVLQACPMDKDGAMDDEMARCEVDFWSIDDQEEKELLKIQKRLTKLINK